MSNVVTLTTLSNANVKKAMEKLKQSALFMSSEDRTMYLQNMDQESQTNLKLIIDSMNSCDDNIKVALFIEVLKELGIKAIALNTVEDRVIEQDMTLTLLTNRINELEQVNADNAKCEEEYSIRVKERAKRDADQLNKMNENKLFIKRNRDPVLKSKALSKAIFNTQ